MIWVHAVQLHKHEPSVTGFIFRYVYLKETTTPHGFKIFFLFRPNESNANHMCKKKWANIKYIL